MCSHTELLVRCAARVRKTQTWWYVCLCPTTSCPGGGAPTRRSRLLALQQQLKKQNQQQEREDQESRYFFVNPSIQRLLGRRFAFFGPALGRMARGGHDGVPRLTFWEARHAPLIICLLHIIYVRICHIPKECALPVLVPYYMYIYNLFAPRCLQGLQS